MEKIKTVSKRVLLSYRGLPDKKQYLEFFTAFLSIPMLLTVILLNFNNLKTANKADTKPTAAPAQQRIYIPAPTAADKITNNTANNPSNTACKPEIGPIQIVSPTEGETVTDNPASIDVSYNTGTYCSVVWAYRINGGNWSDYDNKSIALYNLPQGNVKMDLRIKSLASTEEKNLIRNFVYKGNTNIVVPSPTIQTDKTSSASATQ